MNHMENRMDKGETNFFNIARHCPIFCGII